MTYNVFGGTLSLTQLINPSPCMPKVNCPGKGFRELEQVTADVTMSLFIGCDVNLANVDGSTPLSLACSVGSDVIVELLLKHPTVDVDQGVVRTPLHEAATVGSTSIVQRLINAGCNVNKVRARFYCC